jgi:hypothetical protein
MKSKLKPINKPNSNLLNIEGLKWNKYLIKKINKKITQVNLDRWPALCCGSDQIVSNIKQGCSSDANVFKEERKIRDLDH